MCLLKSEREGASGGKKRILTMERFAEFKSDIKTIICSHKIDNKNQTFVRKNISAGNICFTFIFNISV
jgi:hypothetical protein